MRGMLAHYEFVDPDALAYFAARPPQARRDVDVALAFVREQAVTRRDQNAVMAALTFKCDILWAMLDALEHAYVAPGRVPSRRLGAGRVTAPIDPAARPRLASGVKLREDPARGGWVLLAPERVLATNAVAAEILKLCDGERSVATLVDDLAALFAADRARIAADVQALLADLAAKRVVSL
jgi:pyrroloquinoline quinone biosynthesis protein D